jgi:hypothetical protein
MNLANIKNIPTWGWIVLGLGIFILLFFLLSSKKSMSPTQKFPSNYMAEEIGAEVSRFVIDLNAVKSQVSALQSGQSPSAQGGKSF